MPQLTILSSQKTKEFNQGTLLLDALKEMGVAIDAPCGGYGVCGKCLVQVTSGTVEYENTGIIPENMLNDGYVLACKAKLNDTSVTINAAVHKEKEVGKFLKMSEEMHLVQDGLLPTEEDIEPIVKHILVKVEEAQMGDGLSDYDRLEQAILSKIDVSFVKIPLKLLVNLPVIIRENNGDVTVSYYIENNTCNIVGVDYLLNKVNYGVAVDIGTTTVAASLVNLENGEIMFQKTDYNAQVSCGLDIISRINYAKKPERLLELRNKVRDTINSLIKELSAQAEIAPNEIMNASIAGNPTMLHLFMGIIPEYIRLSPYTPTLYKSPLFKASELGIAINSISPVFIAPSVGSYLGGDITSGVLCTSLATDSEEMVLFIDVGTNGEIVIGNNEFLMGCACSAGPAFEGGGLKCGMRASVGAIEKVEIDVETGKPTCHTIDNVSAVGICGSGIICLLAEMLKTGWIDPAGKLNRNKPCEYIDTTEKIGKYILVSAENSGTGNPIYISEADIENIIRAKAAIFSACMTMLSQVDMSFSDLSRLYVAGGFGRYLDIENSQKIGLLPKIPKENFSFLGNSSLLGSYMTLVSRKHREKELEIAQKITYIDLGSEPSYMDQYTAALFLPHTDAKLFAD